MSPIASPYATSVSPRACWGSGSSRRSPGGDRHGAHPAPRTHGQLQCVGWSRRPARQQGGHPRRADVRRRGLVGVLGCAAGAGAGEARTGRSGRRRRRAIAAPQPGARRGTTRRQAPRRAARAPSPPCHPTDSRFAAPTRRGQEAARRDQALPPPPASTTDRLERWRSASIRHSLIAARVGCSMSGRR